MSLLSNIEKEYEKIKINRSIKTIDLRDILKKVYSFSHRMNTMNHLRRNCRVGEQVTVA
jgi:hypothetical protein